MSTIFDIASWRLPQLSKAAVIIGRSSWRSVWLPRWWFGSLRQADQQHGGPPTFPAANALTRGTRSPDHGYPRRCIDTDRTTPVTSMKVTFHYGTVGDHRVLSV